jgi:2-oxoglutarate ferredoxin oxidoreductase subunit beta
MSEVASTKADFASNQEVRWCPGCGDYAILATMQRLLPELGVPKENIVFISGIGCSGRFPYYMNTYGVHSIHGRAPTIATGLKLTRPELPVWIITGDGDGLSIGANHLLHILRRNVDVKILLFNNRIYGLTKGQYSPTSEQGKVTQTTPFGSLDQPLNPIAVALAAGASFVARVIDIDAKGLHTVLKAAHEHKGSAFIEIYQNCNIFNDKAFAQLSDKSLRSVNTIWLEHEQPLTFAEGKQGLSFQQGQLEIVDTDNSTEKAKLLIHNVRQPDSTLAYSLCALQHPVAFGIFRQVERPTYEQLAQQQFKQVVTQHGLGELKVLLEQGQVWEVV